MEFSQILLYAHSGLRWIVVLVSLVTLALLVIRLIQNGTVDKTLRMLLRVFSAVIGIQVLLGIILLIARGTWLSHEIEHAVIMIIAIVVSNGYMAFRKRGDRAYIVSALISMLLTLGLIYLGVARLPQGWS